jgi:hypothetical protein
VRNRLLRNIGWPPFTAASILSALLMATEAWATPIWQDAARWTCRADEMSVCTADNCKSSSTGAVFEIDFQTGVFHPLGVEAKYFEHVTVKKFYDTLGFSKIGLDSGDSIQFSNTAGPEPGFSPNARKFTATRGGFPDVVSYFGTCFPGE